MCQPELGELTEGRPRETLHTLADVLALSRQQKGVHWELQQDHPGLTCALVKGKTGGCPTGGRWSRRDAEDFRKARPWTWRKGRYKRGLGSEGVRNSGRLEKEKKNKPDQSRFLSCCKRNLVSTTTLILPAPNNYFLSHRFASSVHPT